MFTLYVTLFHLVNFSKKNIYFYRQSLTNKKYTYLNAEEKPRCLATRSKTKTSFPCSCKRNVFASTSRRIRLKCSLSTRNRWQLFSFSTIVAALPKANYTLSIHAFNCKYECCMLKWIEKLEWWSTETLFFLLSIIKIVQMKVCNVIQSIQCHSFSLFNILKSIIW